MGVILTTYKSWDDPPSIASPWSLTKLHDNSSGSFSLVTFHQWPGESSWSRKRGHRRFVKLQNAHGRRACHSSSPGWHEALSPLVNDHMAVAGISPIFNRKYIFKWSIVHCYVSLPECNWASFKKRAKMVVDRVFDVFVGDDILSSYVGIIS